MNGYKGPVIIQIGGILNYVKSDIPAQQLEYFKLIDQSFQMMCIEQERTQTM